MSISDFYKQPKALRVQFDEENLIIFLESKKKIEVPLWKFPRIENLDIEEKESVSIHALGRTLDWECIDEILSVEYLENEFGSR
jgi:hypothetical protein